jgi:hypothetical protein
MTLLYAARVLRATEGRCYRAAVGFRRRFALFSVGFALCFPAAARAEVDRIALIGLPDNLAAAVSTALDPWRIEIVRVGNPPPGSSMPSAAEQATQVAARERAGAVVWLANDGTGDALWIYDAESGRTTARSLVTPPPFDDPTAAAVALTIKTLLRFSAVAPATERYVTVVEREVAPPPGRFALGGEGGLRWRRHTGARDLEPRLGLVVSYRPPLAGDHLLARAAFRLGPGIAIDEAGFVGHFSDLEAALGAGADLALAPRLTVGATVGGALHFTEIDGSLPASGTGARARRINPAVSACLTFSARVGARLELGAEIEGSYSLRRQRYLVGGEPVLDLPAGELEGRVTLAVPIQ